NFRRLALQEFAEDAETCFLASGECVFDVELIERRLRALPPSAESRDNGKLLIWFPARGRSGSEHNAGYLCNPERSARAISLPSTPGGHRAPALRSGCENSTPNSSAYIIGVDPAGGGADGD